MMDKFYDVSKEQASKDLDYMWSISQDVADVLAPMKVHIGWIARQSIGGYGFTISDGYAYISDEDLYSVDRGILVDRCAEEILGYPVNSPQHIAHQISFWRKQLGLQIEERDRAAAEVENIRTIINKLEAKWTH